MFGGWVALHVSQTFNTKLNCAQQPDIQMYSWINLQIEKMADGECFCQPDPVLWTLHLSGEHFINVLTCKR